MEVTEEELQEFMATLVERGKVIVKGIEIFRLLRKAIERRAQNAGLVVEWDPSSAVDLRAWLGIMSLSAMRWAIAGSVLGLVAGGLSDRAGTACAVGGAIGALLGSIYGYQAVQQGWRLRSYCDEQGIVCVAVEVLPRGYLA